MDESLEKSRDDDSRYCIWCLRDDLHCRLSLLSPGIHCCVEHLASAAAFQYRVRRTLDAKLH